MRKNFLTTGVVIALAWISLAPLSLLFIATISSSSYTTSTKFAALCFTLFSWIFLSMGTGLLWRKESEKKVSVPKKEKPVEVVKTHQPIQLITLQNMSEENFASLCLRIFERMWPGVTVEALSPEGATYQNWMIHLPQKVYLVHCENQKTFFDSREVEAFRELMQKRGAWMGYFFATGIFSLSAQTLAREGRIELIDGQKALELMESFLIEKDFLSYKKESVERRRYTRFSFDQFPSHERPVLDLGNVYQQTMSTPARIVNLSSGGVCVDLAQTEELPTFFQLRLKLPALSSSLHVLGEVVWNEQKARGAGRRFGISFVSMADDHREKLDLFLNRHRQRRVPLDPHTLIDQEETAYHH